MFDPKCLELAEHFLDKCNTEHAKIALAEHIQETIEIYLCNLASRTHTALLKEIVQCGPNPTAQDI
jgi:hypothetical protein